VPQIALLLHTCNYKSSQEWNKIYSSAMECDTVAVIYVNWSE